MDVLEFSFESDRLKEIQNEVRSLSSVSTSVLIIGDAGAGKTTWSQAICRFDGIAQIIESHEAPKSIRGWKDISQNWEKNPVILENVDKWTDAVQCSFIQFIKEQKRCFKRIVATSSTRLISKIREGQFRTDVYYFLAVRRIELPKLTECLPDFERIVGFWSEVSGLMAGQSTMTTAKTAYSKEASINAAGLSEVLSKNALAKLRSHDWRGNFTELVNVLERAMSFSQGIVTEQQIRFDDWNHDLSELEAGLTLAAVEKKLIMQTLNLTAQNKSQAARLLGISIRTLRNKLNEYRSENTQEAMHELI